jgi:hypothetical protein
MPDLIWRIRRVPLAFGAAAFAAAGGFSTAAGAAAEDFGAAAFAAAEGFGAAAFAAAGGCLEGEEGSGAVVASTGPFGSAAPAGAGTFTFEEVFFLSIFSVFSVSLIRSSP